MIPYFDTNKMIVVTRPSIPRRSVELSDLVFSVSDTDTDTKTDDDVSNIADSIAINHMLYEYSQGYEAEIYDAWAHRRIAEYDFSGNPIYYQPPIGSGIGINFSASKTKMIPSLSGKENDARNFLTTVLFEMFKIKGLPSEEVYYITSNNDFHVNKAFGFQSSVRWPYYWKGTHIEYIDPNPIGVIVTLDRALDLDGIPGFQDRVAKYMLLQLWYEANVTRGEVSQSSHDWAREILINGEGTVLLYEHPKGVGFEIHPYTWKIDMGQILRVGNK